MKKKDKGGIMLPCAARAAFVPRDTGGRDLDCHDQPVPAGPNLALDQEGGTLVP